MLPNPICELKNYHWKPKVFECDSKWWPKVPPKPLKWLWVGPSKHLVFIVWKPLGEGLEINFVSACLPGVIFFRILTILIDFGIQMKPQMGSTFLPDGLQMVLFLHKASTCSHSGVQSRSRVPNLLSNRAPGFQKSQT